MREQKNVNGGCDALTLREGYDSRKEGRRGLHRSGMPWWTNGKANIVLVPIFSTMDGLVLYSIFDECMTQSAVMGIIMAFGVAVVLNILPLVIARFLHSAFDRTAKHAVPMVLVFISAFLLIYGSTVYLRFTYRDMYGETDQGLVLENTVADEAENSSTAGSDNARGTAVVMLLSISPLITSVLGFAIAYVSDDETKKKVEYLELEKIAIDEKINDTQAALIQMEAAMKEGVEKDLEQDLRAMEAAIREIFTRCDVLKAQARYYLAEYLADPSATSRLSQELLSEKGGSEASTQNNSAEMGESSDSQHYGEGTYKDYYESEHSVAETVGKQKLIETENEGKTADKVVKTSLTKGHEQDLGASPELSSKGLKEAG